MIVEAWCGNCGQSFRLVQVIEEGAGGRCPRCGIAFNNDYNAVVTTAIRQFLQSAAVMNDMAQQLAATAPLLHIDRDALYKALDAHLNR